MPVDPLPDGLAEHIEHVREATGRLLAGLDGLTGADPASSSLCPGWTTGHILTHLARNADGLRRSAEGARRGEQVPMYDSEQARDADIEAGAARPMPELIADVSAAAQALAGTWSAMRAADWAHDMPHHRVGLVPLVRTPAMRWGEVEIHRVDLAAGYLPSDWPGTFVAYLLASNRDALAGPLPDGTRLELHATDTAERWTAGPADAARTVISGPSWAIAAWLEGRPGPAAHALSSSGGTLPALPS